MANRNKILSAAKEAKQDEFYTQLSDIENELRHYKEYFKDKIVLCNCDDPYESNFFKYFAINFNHLGLRKLICTCYAGSPVIYTQMKFAIKGSELEIVEETDRAIKEYERKPYVIEITEVKDLNGDGAIDLTDIKLLLKSVNGKPRLLKGDGDFRSEECDKLLKEADIVVTNPPFSLFREYVAKLIEHNKKFVIIGRTSALHYKEIFPLIQKNVIWTGYGFNLSLVYKTPYKNTEEANRKFVISKGYKPEEGYVKVPAICWYTNLDVKKRHEKLIMYKEFNEEEYPHYTNFDGIDVNEVNEIPCDYYGNMGVPDTFLELYNPEQFEIIGLGCGNLGKEIGVKKNYRGRTDLSYIKNGKPACPYSRIIVRRKKVEE